MPADGPVFSRDRLEALAATTLALTAAGFFLQQVTRVGWQVVDDAAISAAFARTALAGAGFRATPLSQPVEAFSNPLWTLLLMLSGAGDVPDFAGWARSGMELGLLCLTRPEALLFALLVLGSFTLSRLRQQGAAAWRPVGGRRRRWPCP